MAAPIRERDLPLAGRTLLTVREVAALWGVSASAVSDLCRTGALRSVQIAGPRSRRIRREWADEYIDKEGSEA